MGGKTGAGGSEGFTNVETEYFVAKKPELGLRGKFLNVSKCVPSRLVYLWHKLLGHGFGDEISCLN